MPLPTAASPASRALTVRALAFRLPAKSPTSFKICFSSFWGIGRSNPADPARSRQKSSRGGAVRGALLSCDSVGLSLGWSLTFVLRLSVRFCWKPGSYGRGFYLKLKSIFASFSSSGNFSVVRTNFVRYARPVPNFVRYSLTIFFKVRASNSYDLRVVWSIIRSISHLHRGFALDSGVYLLQIPVIGCTMRNSESGVGYAPIFVNCL